MPIPMVVMWELLWPFFTAIERRALDGTYDSKFDANSQFERFLADGLRNCAVPTLVPTLFLTFECCFFLQLRVLLGLFYAIRRKLFNK